MTFHQQIQKGHVAKYNSRLETAKGLNLLPLPLGPIRHLVYSEYVVSIYAEFRFNIFVKFSLYSFQGSSKKCEQSGRCILYIWKQDSRSSSLPRICHVGQILAGSENGDYADTSANRLLCIYEASRALNKKKKTKFVPKLNKNSYQE